MKILSVGVTPGDTGVKPNFGKCHPDFRAKSVGCIVGCQG